MGERVSERDTHTEDRNERSVCVCGKSVGVVHQTPNRDRQSIIQSNVSWGLGTQRWSSPLWSQR